ncbi:MAG: PilZ domain-containing protein [Vitreoscilla sp.]
MSTTPADDVAAMFDLAPLAESTPSPDEAAAALAAAEAAEAALAAEIESTMASGGFAEDAPDSRTDHRVPVSWPARMRLPDGSIVDLHVRNVSHGGVGLTSDAPIPAYTVVDFEMGAPPLEGGGAATPVTGTIRTTYTVVQGAKVLCGGTWQAPPAGIEVVKGWIRRLRD